ncbi:phospholipid-translocating P-type flippase family protein [Cryptosporidium andersoni]|uniref:Phospholipid-translocating P-type flippase family protein n=1 Tax=Cryptosporidium andersoni TaxID=117008 RepID=A0A1J4MNH6_9CRYT|nr:phospholipid-translocating P-type flippase family protein [Cryptosporidium andersoni]
MLKRITKLFTRKLPENINTSEPEYITVCSGRFVPQNPCNIVYGVSDWVNSVRTYKYEWWNFIPLNLFSQLIQPSNFYFLVLAMLQIVPVISESDGNPTILIPLTIVVLITAIKDGLEDVARHNSDRAENSKLCNIVDRNGEIQEAKWVDLKPGDIVFLKNEERIPSDLVLLSCSDKFGMCYVETAQLDGESFLKTKICVNEFQQTFKESKSFSNYSIKVEYGPPSSLLYNFFGVVKVRKSLISENLANITNSNERSCISFEKGVSQKTLGSYISNSTTENKLNLTEYSLSSDSINSYEICQSVSIDQFLWRGASIQNTSWAYGIVVYTGHNTRILRNSSKQQRLKYSPLSRMYQQHAILLALIQITICFILALLSSIYGENSAIYNPNKVTNGRLFIINMLISFAVYTLLLSYFVPITLLVQLEIIRFIQGFFLHEDKEASEQSESLCGVKSRSLVDALGCVTHIFSDKTGTLTKNSMQLCGIIIAGKNFKSYNAMEDRYPTEAKIYTDKCACIDDIENNIPNPYINFDAKEVRNFMLSLHRKRKKFHLARDFCLNLAVCHNVLPKVNEAPKEQEADTSTSGSYEKSIPISSNLSLVYHKFSKEANFDASSPDELSLVAGAKHIGLEFVHRPSLDSIEVIILEESLYEMFFTKQQCKYIYKVKNKIIESYSDYINKFWCPCIRVNILETFDFDSDRKRMSVIIEDNWTKYDQSYKNNQTGGLLLIKGADSSMLSICKFGQEDEINNMSQQLRKLAMCGLRTLVFGSRRIDPDLLQEILLKAKEAKMCLDNTKEEKLRLTIEVVEKDIQLCGCTGIEDKLQEQVPETIADIRSAGIKLWVLTGDKLETAISIGYSSSILTEGTYNIIISSTDNLIIEDQLRSELARILRLQLKNESFRKVLRVHFLQQSTSKTEGKLGIKFLYAINSRLRRWLASRNSSPVNCQLDLKNHCIGNLGDTENTSVEPLDSSIIEVYLRHMYSFEFEKLIVSLPNEAKSGISGNSPLQTSQIINIENSNILESYYHSIAITVTGESLSILFSSDNLKQLFFGLARFCSSVIVCRATPLQKGDIVGSAKKYNKGIVSLAIGDGANDTNMIVTADVGIGITGKEGLQAASVSDFTIGEFRLIRKLLLCHGHENLRRNSDHVYITITKNVVMGLVDCFYAYFCIFSGTDIFNSWIKQLYNLLFTPIAHIIVAIFDRMLPHYVLARIPSLYPVCLPRSYKKYFGYRRFMLWIALSIWSVVTLTFIPLFTLGSIISGGEGGGKILPMKIYGQIVFMTIVIAVNLMIIPLTHTWFLFVFISIIVGPVFFIIGWIVCPSSFCPTIYGSFRLVHLIPQYYLVNFVSIFISILPQIIFWFGEKVLYPSPIAIVRERVAQGVCDTLVSRSKGEIVIPCRSNKQWKGYAFTDSSSRWVKHREVLENKESLKCLEEKLLCS